MPELPEVQTVVNTLRPKLLAARFVSVNLRRQDIVEPKGFDLSAALIGRVIDDIARSGKRIVIRLDNGDHFFIHLGMTGRLTIDSPDADVPPHTHFSAILGSVELRFRDPRRFGGIWWLGDRPLPEIGPEPLTMSSELLRSQLSRTHRPLKNALLDQSVVAGLGNIYVDESLFEAALHPLTPADQLSLPEVQRLNRAIKQTLRKALKHRGSTLRDYVDAEGGRGAFQKLHRVYDREGLDCVNCKTPITRIVLGGRSTCFCPQCQKPIKARRGRRKT